jgi:hypothetical protein
LKLDHRTITGSLDALMQDYLARPGTAPAQARPSPGISGLARQLAGNLA